MLYLISYDIPDTPRRTKVAKILKDFGDRVQYSVFECLLDGELLEKMRSRLEKVLVEAEDSLRIYALCGKCEKGVTVIGQGEVSKEEKYYIL
ncbi:MAG: CRISPR-associated endonuclease Cas2 [Nitrospinae bacterium]|nr:CRISPR-associated endonuclease Cas2 [Nitrospinota bacterium]